MRSSPHPSAVTNRHRVGQFVTCLSNRPVLVAMLMVLVGFGTGVSPACGQTPDDLFSHALAEQSPLVSDSSALVSPQDWTSPERVQSTLQIVLLMSVVSLAPAILLMTTSFVRIVVVLSLLRQALGTQQLPPNQVITSLAMFMTLLLMTPVWSDVYHDAVQPYTDPAVAMSWDEAWQAGIQPIRRFMSRQIEIAGHSDDVWLFYQYLPESQRGHPSTYDDVPLQVLLPAFVLSELKIAFLIGFQIYLPFLIVDIVVSSITVSMGMMMLPPTMVSLPLKLMLFVLVDGWNLVVGMLMQSFVPYT